MALAQRKALMFQGNKLVNFFRKAYDYVEEKHPEDIEYTRARSPEDFEKNWDSQRFMQQYAWVVYVAGFRAEILGNKSDELRKAFCDFNIDKICAMPSLDPVLKIFNNKRKAKCVLEGAREIRKGGFDKFKKRILDAPEEKRLEILDELPGIGHINRNQLAKDIGVADVHKNDIYIQRLAALLSEKDDVKMIQYLVDKFSDKLKKVYLKKAFVDSVLWKFCEQKGWKQEGYKSLGSFIAAL